jgi:hypothetical protein
MPIFQQKDLTLLSLENGWNVTLYHALRMPMLWLVVRSLLLSYNAHSSARYKSTSDEK